MPIDWILGLVGGLMIGGAAALYLVGGGRIMGASGILGALVDGSGRTGDRVAFVAGLVVVPAVISVFMGGAQTHLTGSLGVVVIAGLLVGFGTRLANGCTSGHGVCGISRLSPRGLVATLCYLLAGAIAVIALKGIL